MAGRRARRIARANTRLRYGAQERTLSALVGQAKEELKTDQRVASGVAATAVRSARRARAPLAQIYAQSQSAADAAHSDVEAAFGRTGTGADAFRAVTDREFGLDQSRRAEAAANEQAGLRRQENQARLGKLFAHSAAKQRYNATVSQLQDQALALAGEKRDYQVTQLNEQRQANRAGQVTPRDRFNRGTQWGSAGRDPKTGEKLPGEDGTKRTPASRDDLRSFQSRFSLAVSQAKELKENAGFSREEIEKALTEGTPNIAEKGKPKLPDGRDNPDFRPFSKGVKQVDNQLAIQAALDQVYRGGLSKANFRRLRNQTGIRVSQIPGLLTPKQARVNERKRRQGIAKAQEDYYSSY